MKAMRPAKFRVLYAKEWARLKRNPAALMAVGLLILMAFLITIESGASARAAQIANWPCLVMYNTEDDFIRHLKANRNPGLAVKFLHQAESLEIHQPSYGRIVSCAVEIFDVEESSSRPSRRIVLRHGDGDMSRINGLSRWVLSSLAAFHSGLNIEQGMLPLPNHQPPRTRTNLDLSSSKSKAMVSAMLLFSTQFFICCALFISFTSHEKERGILQALALTPASPRMILLVKIAFHLTLSLLASGLMVAVIAPGRLIWFPLWLVIILSSLGLVAVGTMISSFNRTQTSASLMGFCYLMVIGVIFALSQSFPGFAALRAVMFENHVIASLGLLFDTMTRASLVSVVMHGLYLLVIVPLLLGMAIWIWNRRGWQQG